RSHSLRACELSDARHSDRHRWRIARRLSCRQYAVSLSASRETLLRIIGNLRPPRFHGRDVRRQLLLSESGRLHGESHRPVVPRAVIDLRNQAGDRNWTIRKERLLVHDVGDSRAARYSAFARRLGSAGRTRLALLEGATTG